MEFNDEFSTKSFTREGTIPPNWTYLVQCISHSGALENIDINDTWFTTYIDKYSSKTPSYNPSVAPENNNKTITLLQSEPHVQDSTVREGAYVSEAIKFPASKGVQKTSNLKKFPFAK